jgi:hypothetical protein
MFRQAGKGLPQLLPLIIVEEVPCVLHLFTSNKEL